MPDAGCRMPGAGCRCRMPGAGAGSRVPHPSQFHRKGWDLKHPTSHHFCRCGAGCRVPGPGAGARVPVPGCPILRSFIAKGGIANTRQATMPVPVPDPGCPILRSFIAKGGIANTRQATIFLTGAGAGCRVRRMPGAPYIAVSSRCVGIRAKREPFSFPESKSSKAGAPSSARTLRLRWGHSRSARTVFTSASNNPPHPHREKALSRLKLLTAVS
jgi:hypothetical protein